MYSRCLSQSKNASSALLWARRCVGAVTAPFLDSAWSKAAPTGFQYAWLPEADTVTLVPQNWFTACEAQEGKIRYIVSKEDALTNKQYKTGYSVTQWQCDEIPADIVMDQISNQHLGVLPSMYMSQILSDSTLSIEQQFQQEIIAQFSQKQNKIPSHHTSILSYLKDLNIHLIDHKTHELPNILKRKTIEFVKLQPEEKKGDLLKEKEPDTYVLSHVFAFPLQNVVLSFLFECPISMYNEYKPVMDTVLDYSVLGCHSEKNRILFSTILAQDSKEKE
eukprot:CAMPEP_0117041580 /NCGR_PEP_ID=MMETSP0472-20121206/29022_1 /TAXON_ID=693140 ORGANISM="Tiarina fusus, Strain LIS" /NCGR_SAMPLE_ID=MMETSP0472 /ASSEMBLY_ACC=CAM_ASM_000603 /LENGTH=276 /DNA_ID=CAMNT_0004752615 /DNA_START=10 /DNA_END=840 /DNA_ORIENTATION=+